VARRADTTVSYTAICTVALSRKLTALPCAAPALTIVCTAIAFQSVTASACAVPGRFSNIHTIKIVDTPILFIEAPPAMAACALTAREQQPGTHWLFDPLALLDASCSAAARRWRNGGHLVSG